MLNAETGLAPVAKALATHHDLDKLAGKIVTMPDGYVYGDFLRRNFPQVKILTISNTLAAIEAVQSQQADAALGDLVYGLLADARDKYKLRESANNALGDEIAFPTKLIAGADKIVNVDDRSLSHLIGGLV